MTISTNTLEPIVQVVCITGASRGIGKAVAQRLAWLGYRLMLVGREEASLQAVRMDLLQQTGCTADRVAYYCADLTHPAVAPQVIQATVQAFGRLDVLINNAGVGGKVGLISELDDAALATMVTLNLHSPMLLSKYAVQAMVNQGSGGTLMFINSIAGKTAFPYWAVYDATKHGLKAFADALMEEQRHNGIRCLSVYPGACDTAIWDTLDLAVDDTPNREGMLRPADVAEAVAFALQQPARVMMNDITLQPTLPVL
jgi:NADP-dependent 3-hydroxy acid dehydrogenase YdfG